MKQAENHEIGDYEYICRGLYSLILKKLNNKAMFHDIQSGKVECRIQVRFRRAWVDNDRGIHPQCWDIMDTSGYCFFYEF
jgi:hypothetical protein